MSFVPDGTLDHLRNLGGGDAPEARYELGPEIGRGGMGVVYEARDRWLDRAVALKVVDAQEAAGEAKTLAQLEHPGLVPVYDAGTLPDGRPFYAMRLVRGRRLDEYLRDEAAVPARLRIFEKVCEAVAFAHDRGIIHCDLKPQNIMVGGYGEVFVLDWGVARRTGVDGAAFGTPRYMAPEREGLDGRADVFGLGRILEDMAGAGAQPPLASIIRKCVAERREDRYAGVQALERDVNRYLDGFPVSAHRDTAWERTARFVRRNQILLLLVGSYLVVKLAMLFLGRR